MALLETGAVQLILVQGRQGQPGMWLHPDVGTEAQVDELYIDGSAEVIEAPSIRPWGTYEPGVEDLDQHTFRVAAPTMSI